MRTFRQSLLGALLAFSLMLITSGCANKHADAYNAYVKLAKPHVLGSDKVLEEIKKSATDENAMRRQVADWEKTLISGKAALKTVSPEHPGLKAMHDHLIARQQALIEGVQAMKKALAGDASLNPVIREKMQASTQHLQAYLKARDAFGEKHGVRFK